MGNILTAMPKLEIDKDEKVIAWLASPGPASFQGLDLTSYGPRIAAAPLSGCSFLGCTLPQEIVAAATGCLILPAAWPELGFTAIRNRLYSPAELYDRFDPNDPEASYRRCKDRKIYESYVDTATGEPKNVDLEVSLYRRLHDASVSDTLDEALDAGRRLKTVAVMGGHKIKRTAEEYRAVAHLTRVLGMKGYTIVTGGGPGLMEAANLGAYSAGFANAEGVLNQALIDVASAPSFNLTTWMSTAYEAKRRMGVPDDRDKSQNFGIPTWFYGHEPSNFFATDIAKYFENSVREEGLLAIAQAGIIFGPGAGGTTQEIFQDACQNYYRTYGKKKSPMVLYPADYWAPAELHNRHDSRVLSKPAYPLLEKIAIEGGFSDYILCTNSTEAIPPFLESRPPA